MFKYKLFVVILFVFFINFLDCFSADNDSSVVYRPSSFEQFIKRLEYPKNSENKNIIALEYGLSAFSYPNPDVIAKLSAVYHAEIKYGFIRQEEKYKDSKFIHFASESAFIGNYSSHMTIKGLTFDGKTIDGWRFGFGFTNGYGFDYGKSGNLLFSHAGKIMWYKIDFENPGDNPAEQERFSVFDEKYRFGQSFETGIIYSFGDALSINTGYEHSLVFPKVMAGKWMASSFTELLLQRTVDYFGEDFMEDHPQMFPVYNWLAKNAISVIFYELRRNQMNWFFDSEEPINFDSFKIGVTLTF